MMKTKIDFSEESLKLKTPIPITQHPAAVYLSGLSEGSRPTMQYSLDAIASLLTNGECNHLNLDWSQLRYRHTSAVRAALRSRLAASTTNKMMSALRRVLKEALRLDLIEPRTYEKASDFPQYPESREPRGRALSAEEIRQLVDSCNGNSIADIRNLAIVGILRSGGLRRNELVNLDTGDFNVRTGALLVRNGKGGKDRTVYLSEQAIAFVNHWIEVRGNAPGPLLLPIDKVSRIYARRMTPDAILKIVQKLADRAGIKPFSPHDFRRTFCSDLLDAGVDIVTVQKLAGHTSPTVTAKYDRRGDETLRKAVQHLGL
jgi:integrase